MKIAVLSSVPFGFLRQRPQHIAIEMAKLGHDVTYVGNAGIELTFSGHKIGETISQFGVDKIRNTIENEVFPPLFSGATIDGVRVIDNVVVSVADEAGDKIATSDLFYRSFCRHADYDVLLMYYPRHIDYADNSRPIVYDCVDLFSGFSGEPKDIVIFEEKTIQRARLVFATQKNLVDIIAKRSTAPVVLVENGTDAIVSERIVRLSDKKVAGFIGAVAEWINLPLLNDCAKIIKDEWEIHIIGPQFVETFPFRNLFFHEYIEKYKIGEYLSGFDVGLIPFKKERLDRTRQPHKIL